jgi:3-methyladenine DNA glycosylase Tag
MLAKRDNFRKAFAGFGAEQVARYGPRDVAVAWARDTRVSMRSRRTSKTTAIRRAIRSASSRLLVPRLLRNVLWVNTPAATSRRGRRRMNT